MSLHADSHLVAGPPALRFGLSATHEYGQHVTTDTKPKDNGAHANDGTVSSPAFGILSRFKGKYEGFGWNTIFRPNSTATRVHLPNTPSQFSDNLLLLNLTGESMTFGQPLDGVPNRGLLQQPDVFLNGVPYTQAIRDETFKAKPGQDQPNIHLETGMWMHLPASTSRPADPRAGPSNNAECIFRMAPIPHGTTLNAQCFDKPTTTHGAPLFPKVSITPTLVNGGQQIVFENQTFENAKTFRIPQDLSGFQKQGLITPEMLANPNSVLTNANKGKEIIECTTFTVSTPAPHHLGGGTANIAFLVGNDSGKSVTSTLGRSGNANASSVSATFWICKVRARITLKPGQKTASPVSLNERDAVPSFEVDFHVSDHKEVIVQYDQIQYSQLVVLSFAGIDWPHRSVATLAPTGVKLSSVIVKF